MSPTRYGPRLIRPARNSSPAREVLQMIQPMHVASSLVSKVYGPTIHTSPQTLMLYDAFGKIMHSMSAKRTILQKYFLRKWGKLAIFCNLAQLWAESNIFKEIVA